MAPLTPTRVGLRRDTIGGAPEPHLGNSRTTIRPRRSCAGALKTSLIRATIIRLEAVERLSWRLASPGADAGSGHHHERQRRGRSRRGQG